LLQATRYEFDEAYVDRLTAGDPGVERHFTDYFGPLLTVKLRMRLRSVPLVDDARQEVFLRVLTTLRQQGGLASAGSLGAFVNAVCNNVLFETYRSQSRQRRAVDDDNVELEAPGESAESGLIQAATGAEVRHALGTLPEKDQTLLRWLFFEERDKNDICRSLGIDRAYLRVMLFRAKARFREALAGTGPATPTGSGPGETSGRERAL
jgi:RNA polymerase sigma-70 factor (ECF subfamily)